MQWGKRTGAAGTPPPCAAVQRAVAAVQNYGAEDSAQKGAETI